MPHISQSEMKIRIFAYLLRMNSPLVNLNFTASPQSSFLLKGNSVHTVLARGLGALSANSMDFFFIRRTKRS